MDKFIALDITLDKMLELAENRPLALFELVRGLVESEVGEISSVSVYRKYFDSETLDVVLEYLIRCNLGELSVKILYSDNPARALSKYYEFERVSAKGGNS
jgi:hypothetical protein